MDVKKSRTAAFDGKKIIAFVGEVKQELKKIDWTTKEELKLYTKLVLLSTFIFGFFVYGIDLVMRGALGGIENLLKLIV